MTREEFLFDISDLPKDGYLYKILSDHDASQRALIEQQAAQIVMADHVYQLLAEAHEQQAKEIARLRGL